MLQDENATVRRACVMCFASIAQILPAVLADEDTFLTLERAVLRDSDPLVIEAAAVAMWMLGMRARLREKL